MANALLDGADINAPGPTIMSQLAKRPDSPLGRKTQKAIVEHAEWRTGYALERLGLDAGFHRYAIRLTADPAIHLVYDRRFLSTGPIAPTLCERKGGLHRHSPQRVRGADPKPSGPLPRLRALGAVRQTQQG